MEPDHCALPRNLRNLSPEAEEESSFEEEDKKENRNPHVPPIPDCLPDVSTEYKGSPELPDQSNNTSHRQELTQICPNHNRDPTPPEMDLGDPILNMEISECPELHPSSEPKDLDKEEIADEDPPELTIENTPLSPERSYSEKIDKSAEKMDHSKSTTESGSPEFGSPGTILPQSSSESTTTKRGRAVRPVDHFAAGSASRQRSSRKSYSTPNLNPSLRLSKESTTPSGEWKQIYYEGDIVWGHLAGYPYWPGMITKLEGEASIFQVRQNNKNPQYSVVFFDDGRFCWMLEKNILPFEGFENFERLRHEKYNAISSSLPKPLEKALRRRWMVPSAAMNNFYQRALTLAEELLPLEKEHRCLRLKRCRGKLEIISLEEAEKLNATPDEEIAVNETPRSKIEKRGSKRSVSRSISPKKRLKLMSSSTGKLPQKENSQWNEKLKKSAVANRIVKKLKILGNKKTSEQNSVVQRRAKKQEDENSDEDDADDDMAFINLLFTEPACHSCQLRIEETSSCIKCSGFCKRTFHMECLPPNTERPYICDLCSAGKKWCFSCQDPSSSHETFQCTKKCWRFYHMSCIAKRRIGDVTPSPQKPRSLRCPFHTCVTCMARDRTQKAKRGRMMQCLICPTAFHRTEVCVPAGAILLNQDTLICSAHYDKAEAASGLNPHVNVDYCFECGSGGKLVCCETCPLAYHEGCLKETVPEAEAWRCVGCKSGIEPMYDDLVWAKLGNYRWWPAKVLNPRDIPERIQAKAHTPGEFVVRFLGSSDHAYLTQGRVFLFDEKDSDTNASKQDNTKSVAKSYLKALSDAKDELRAKKERMRAVDEKKALKNGNRGPFFDKPEFKTLTVCPAGRRCENQRFQRFQYAETIAYSTNSKGWGLRAVNEIPEGTFISEYTGDVISQETFRERWKKKSVQNDENFYFLSLDKHRVIDAGPAGSNARFMNHSCDPNCTTLIWRVKGDIRIGIFANTDIEAGEELTFHYNFDSLDATMKMPCHCGGPSCQGFIGKLSLKKEPVFRNGQVTKADSKKRKSLNSAKKTKRIGRRWESHCFLCREGGELICCEKAKCPKVYHMDCVDVTEISKKECWYCPLHYCNECQKPSTRFCSQCTNSYCDFHGLSPRTFRETEDGLICDVGGCMT